MQVARRAVVEIDRRATSRCQSRQLRIRPSLVLRLREVLNGFVDSQSHAVDFRI